MKAECGAAWPIDDKHMPAGGLTLKEMVWCLDGGRVGCVRREATNLGWEMVMRIGAVFSQPDSGVDPDAIHCPLAAEPTVADLTSDAGTADPQGLSALHRGTG